MTDPATPPTPSDPPGRNAERAGFLAILAQWWTHVVEFWFRPVHPARLDTFRRIFTLTFVYYTGYRFLNAYEWLTSYGFHYTAETEDVTVCVPLPLLPSYLVPVFGLLMFGSAAALILGIKIRPAAWVALLCAIYIQNADHVTAFTLNKLYILCFSLFALAPAPKQFICPDGVTRTLQSAWPIRIIQATLIIQYFTAGYCKAAHGDWLSNPDVLWTHVQGIYRTEIAAWLLREMPRSAWTWMGYSALAFELIAPVLFMVRRLRPIGMIWGLGFHIVIALTMKMLIFFSGQMVTFYLLFLDEKTILKIRHWLGFKDDPPTTKSALAPVLARG